MRARILITGAGGQLGQTFQEIAPAFPSLDLVFAGRQELDITDTRAIEAFFGTHELHAVINAAAYTAVDRAETEAEQALAVNVTAVYELARVTAKKGLPFVHYSSDYVYHNDLNRPLRETDPTSPRGVYARTKLKGEQMARQAHPGCTIIRTSWVYSRYGHNFLNTMLRLGRARDELGVVYDQVGAPTWTRDLAEATLRILEAHFAGRLSAQRMAGVFNYANDGVTSWYDFAKAIFRLAGLDCRVRPITSDEYPTPVPRPHYSLMHKGRFRKAFGLDIPHWHDSLRRCMQQMGVLADPCDQRLSAD